jgi:hypothetical protein
VYWAKAGGPLSGPPAWTAATCYLGADGSASFDPGNPAPGSWIHFVVVGNNGAIEGSYGRSSGGAERPAANPQISCGYVQLLTDVCASP